VTARLARAASRLGAVAARGLGQLRRAPATTTLLGLLWTVGVVTGSLPAGPPEPLRAAVGLSPEALAAGRWWVPLAAGLWCGSLAGYLVATGLALAVGGLVERRLGTPATIGVLLVGQLAGGLAGAAVAGLAAGTGPGWLAPAGSGSPVGPVPGLVAAGLAVTARLPRRWRWRVRMPVLVALALAGVAAGSYPQLLAGAAAGLLAGPVRPLAGGRRPGTGLRPAGTAPAGAGDGAARAGTGAGGAGDAPAGAGDGAAGASRGVAWPGDGTAARALLAKYGGASLSYLTTWRGNRYWFGGGGEYAVAYRVAGAVALTTGDPLGPPEAYGEAFREFAEHCRRSGWAVCFYGVTRRIRDLAVAAGWRAVQVGEDAVLPLAGLTFTGRKWQDVRTALNKAGKQGVAAEWCRYADAAPAVTDQVRAISAEWVAGKRMPEMGFTLGGLAELADPEVRCLTAVDADRTVHGIISWLPVYQEGRPVGWTLDFMRRRTGCFPGVMEFLIASSVRCFRAEGAEFVSLSCAPLARLDRGQPAGPAQRLLDLAGRALEPVYGFRSLLAFKAKFQPEYHPLYLVYPDPVALPVIGGAVARAYLPDLTAGQAVRLLGRLLARRPRRRGN